MTQGEATADRFIVEREGSVVGDMRISFRPPLSDDRMVSIVGNEELMRRLRRAVALVIDNEIRLEREDCAKAVERQVGHSGESCIDLASAARAVRGRTDSARLLKGRQAGG